MNTSGWWTSWPLVEQVQRPIEWSNSSVIFTPHPTQPLVLARHFSSSKQFTVPTPPPILAGSYTSPTVISCSPDDQWLFAFFPGEGGSVGAGCLWRHGHEIDTWIVQETWSYQHSAGVVTACWLGGPRQWSTDSSGQPIRLPTRGPRTPASNPTLALITQDNQFIVCYLRNFSQSLTMASCSLTRSSAAFPSQQNLESDVSSSSNTLRVCVRAAFGLGYDGLPFRLGNHSTLNGTHRFLHLCCYAIPYLPSPSP